MAVTYKTTSPYPKKYVFYCRKNFLIPLANPTDC